MGAATYVIAILGAVLLLSAVGCGPKAYKEIKPAAPTTTRAAQPHPNILVIETDDMRADELRWMPNTRKLIQAKGLTFENSFAPYPLCCPSRASFLTGKYTHNHHVYSHENPFGFKSFDDSTTIATALQQAGYQTALIGKYLNGYGQQKVKSTGKSSLDYVPPGWDEWYGASDHLWPSGSKIYGNTYDYFHLVQNINGKIKDFPGRYSTDVMGEQVGSVIDRMTDQQRPWFMWWTPIAPHHGTPIESDDPGKVRRSDGRHTKYVTPARPGRVKGLFDKQITHGLGTPPDKPAEADVSDKPRYLHVPQLTAQEIKAERTLSRQRAEALYVLDHQIGRTISDLSKQGLLDRTIIVFTSDNGFYLGEHRKRQGKITLHEPSLRVPLLIAGPGIKPGNRYDPVTTVDLAPTIAVWAGAELPGVDGIELQHLIASGDKGWTRPVVMESMIPESRYSKTHHALGDQPLNSRGLRLGQWKFTRYSVGREQELYDLLADPLELSSLHKDPAHAGVKDELMALYERYADCAGQACWAPLPEKFQLTAAQEKQLTDAETAAVKKYYANPALK